MELGDALVPNTAAISYNYASSGSAHRFVAVSCFSDMSNMKEVAYGFWNIVRSDNS